MLPHEAKAIEVHVRAGSDGHHGVAEETILLEVFLCPSDTEGACGFQDTPRVVEAGFDGGTDLQAVKGLS